MIVALEPENLFYMTGFWGEAIGILEKSGKTTIIAPELEVGRAKEEGIDKNSTLIVGHAYGKPGVGNFFPVSLTNYIEKNQSKSNNSLV